jgi:hypothetical protein
MAVMDGDDGDDGDDDDDRQATRNAHAPQFNPQHWPLCNLGLYWIEFEFGATYRQSTAQGYA